MRLERARPSASRTVGQPITSTGEGQVLDQAADDRQLLEVLLAEVGPARAGQGEQLGDDGRHPVEVPGPVGAFEPLAEAGHADGGERADRGNISSLVGANTYATPAALGQGQVAVEVPRVGGEVLGRRRTAAG